MKGGAEREEKQTAKKGERERGKRDDACKRRRECVLCATRKSAGCRMLKEGQ